MFSPRPGARRDPVQGHELHPVESALVAITAVHLCLLPWCLGGMHLWTQLASLALSLVGFTVSLAPRRVRVDTITGTAVQQPLSRLVRFPLFWLGLPLLAYVAIQGLNPAWTFATDRDSWWLVPVNYVPWLPSGVAGPLERASPWRCLAVYGSLWLLTCSVWAGLFRRQSLRTLFSVLVANAFLLSMVGILEQLTASQKILWFYTPSNDSFVSTFIYRNHAGPFFNMMVALSVGLGWWHLQRERRAVERRGPSILYSFLAAFIGVMVLFSYSRISIIVLLIFTATAAFALTLGISSGSETRRDRRALAPGAIALLVFIGVGLATLRSDKLWKRFEGAVADPVASIHDRAVVRAAADDMLADRWLLGWGAGSFRYCFPLYAQRYPEIYSLPSGWRKYWEHAHDDLIEFPIELGLAGMLPVLGMLGFVGWRLWRARFWRNAIALSAVLGCALIFAHASVDFVFQNPAVLFTWSFLLLGALRWSELDPPLGRRLALAARWPQGPTAP